MTDVMYGVVVPAIAAIIVARLWRRCVTAESGRPLGTILPFVVGFHAGYWLLGLGPVWPESHWQWLPWLLLLTLPAGLSPLTGRFAWIAQLGTTVVIAAVSGWLLVPAWEHLEPSRIVHLMVFAADVVIVATALQPLTTRIPPLWLTANLTGVLAAGAAILVLSGNLRFSQMAGCGAAALLGIMIAAKLGKNRVKTDGLVLPFTLLATGLMLIGRVNSFSDVPLISYVLVPVAPLSLWLASNDHIAGTGVRRWFALSLPLVVCGVAVGMAVVSEFASADSW